ncbi:MAG: sulfotransferase [Gemmatimonadota bacterium]|nr:sulfotransferase [Gemmatimonadota bacterium]
MQPLEFEPPPPPWAPWRAAIARQPSAFGPLTTWLGSLAREGQVDTGYWARALFVTLVSGLSAPLRLWEEFRYRDLLHHAPIPHPPIFILGHWRSGTTALHYLFARDPRFGVVSTALAAAPGLSLTGGRALQALIGGLSPPTRPMDDLPLSAATPQEDELALSNLCEWSLYRFFGFPSAARRLFDATVMYEGLDAPSREAWRAVYLRLLRVATELSGGRRLVLKSPTHTARIPDLLAVFPDARFIHIHRDPYPVYDSTRQLWERVLAVTTIQRPDPMEMEQNIIYFYQRMMERYFTDRSLIPPGHLAEVGQTEFAKDPLGTMRRLYSELSLDGFGEAEAAFGETAHRLAGHAGHRPPPGRETIERVNQAWGFAFEPLGYERRLG